MRFYDSVTAAMRKVDSELKFMALALAQSSIGSGPELVEYFLNPANHKPGTPIDFITYRFYAHPTPERRSGEWQYTFFYEAEGL